MHTAKLLSLIPLIILLLIGYCIIRREFGYKALLLWDGFFCFLPLMPRYTTEVRMYSWAMLFTAGAALSSYYIVKKGTFLTWSVFTLLSLAASYTHYYAFVTCAYLYFILLIIGLTKRKNKDYLWKFFISAIVALGGYFPWLSHFLSQARKVGEGNFWVQNNNLWIILTHLFNNFYPYSYIFWIILLLTYMIIGIYVCIKKRDVYMVWGTGVFLAFAAVMLVVYIYSVIFSPIITAYYLLIPLCVLIVGIATTAKETSKWMVLISMIFMLLSGRKSYSETVGQIINSTSSLSLIENGATVYTPDYSIQDVLHCYRPDLTVIFDKEMNYNNYEADEYYVADYFIDLEGQNQNLTYIGDNKFKYTEFKIYHHKR